jgi:hypothetical protein
MSAFHSLAPRPAPSLETVHNILGSLAGKFPVVSEDDML